MGCFDVGGKKYCVMNETPREFSQSMRAVTVVRYKPNANENIKTVFLPAQGTDLLFEKIEKKTKETDTIVSLRARNLR